MTAAQRFQCLAPLPWFLRVHGRWRRLADRLHWHGRQRLVGSQRCMPVLARSTLI
jgi:hypothetical protein